MVRLVKGGRTAAVVVDALKHLEHAGERLGGREAEDLAAAKRVEEIRLRVLVQEHEPTLRRPDKAAVGKGLREAAEGEGGLVLETEEAPAMALLVFVFVQWKHQ